MAVVFFTDLVRCTVLQCVATFFMLQCVAVCWQCVAVCCSVLQCFEICWSVLAKVMAVTFFKESAALQCVAGTVLQCVSMCCSVLQRVAACCSVLQRVVVLSISTFNKVLLTSWRKVQLWGGYD